jgi:hypothetical protein
VRSRPTIPRTSYCRKISLLSVMRLLETMRGRAGGLG